MNKFIIEKDFTKYTEIFLNTNKTLNLISKKEEEFLYPKHIYDSLAIKLFFKEYKYIPETILDIGTGGGFPSIPIAIEYPQIKVTGIDSIQKKINAVTNISNNLNLANIKFIRDRVENLNDREFDVITSRAVAKIDKLIEYAYPLLKKDGYMVLYKSKTAEEEIDNSINLIRKYHLKIKPSIEYDLPMDESYTRCLIILQK
ncbi:MAG: 16S rRNA (guanine(527)-N(7))-methyltransferase RsmG [Candidatus Gastranaerophilales bacterium]|nr:16S rRNA (guanine(527)-N(7))-methyltransferase RsmG [Candidatus Gastranaerophilales bacterium]